MCKERLHDNADNRGRIPEAIYEELVIPKRKILSVCTGQYVFLKILLCVFASKEIAKNDFLFSLSKFKCFGSLATIREDNGQKTCRIGSVAIV